MKQLVKEILQFYSWQSEVRTATTVQVLSVVVHTREFDREEVRPLAEVF